MPSFYHLLFVSFISFLSPLPLLFRFFHLSLPLHLLSGSLSLLPLHATGLLSFFFVFILLYQPLSHSPFSILSPLLSNHASPFSCHLACNYPLSLYSLWCIILYLFYLACTLFLSPIPRLVCLSVCLSLLPSLALSSSISLSVSVSLPPSTLYSLSLVACLCLWSVCFSLYCVVPVTLWLFSCNTQIPWIVYKVKWYQLILFAWRPRVCLNMTITLL